MEVGQQVMKLLRNNTLVDLFHEVLRNVTQAQQARMAETEAKYAEFASNLSTTDETQMIPAMTQFLAESVLDNKPRFKEDFEMFARFVRKLDLGNQSRHIKFGLAMAEPFMLTQLDAAMQPTLEQLWALGNSSTKEFCKKVVPSLDNMTASTGSLEMTSKALKAAHAEIPKLAMTPLMFMAPDIVPKIQTLSNEMIDINEGMVQWMQMLTTQTNNTIGMTAFEKLNCRTLMMSGAGQGTSLTIPLLAAAATL